MLLNNRPVPIFPNKLLMKQANRVNTLYVYIFILHTLYVTSMTLYIFVSFQPFVNWQVICTFVSMNNTHSQVSIRKVIKLSASTDLHYQLSFQRPIYAERLPFMTFTANQR